jgi:hypothetical protein
MAGAEAYLGTQWRSAAYTTTAQALAATTNTAM